MISDRKRAYYESLPLLITVCLLPFVVRGHIYMYSGENYGTFIEDVTLADFFSCCKSVVFVVTGVYMLYRIADDMMQGRMKRPCFVVNVCFAVLTASISASGVFALNRHIAFFGGYQRFEGVIVKLLYIVLALYTFQVFGSEDVRSIVRKGAIAAAVPESMIGIAQMTGHDPFMSKLVQNLIMPASYRGSEISNILGDNRVYLTLGNPNYASMYLAAMIIIITGSLGLARSRGRRVFLVLLDTVCFAELVATRSRVGILMLAVPAAIWLAINLKNFSGNKKKALIIFVLVPVMIITGIVTDSVMHLGTWDRIGDSLRSLGQDQKKCNITNIRTEQDGVHLQLGGIEVRASFDGTIDAAHLQVASTLNGREYGSYDRATGMITDENGQAVAGLRDLAITAANVDGESMIIVSESGSEFLFTFDSAYGYMIYAGNGYYEYVEEIANVNMHGFESFASGRGYIWSRTLPLIKGLRAVTGYGPDNFYLAFPQNDYVGKAQYCESPYVIIEKPHNTFLLYCVESGIFAALSFAAAVIYLIISSLGKTVRRDPGCLMTGLLLTAFAAGLFFNDSSIVISPLLWIAIGAACRFSICGNNNME